MSAFETQVDGNHYSKLAIQPMEYSMANKLDACQHTIIKYVTRFRDKGGKKDLEKAMHVINMLIEMEYTEKQSEDINQWIIWNGGNCPVNKEFIVEIKTDCSDLIYTEIASKLSWEHHGTATDIVAYRLLPRAVAQ